MANELTIGGSLTYAGANAASITVGSSGVAVTVATDVLSGGVLSVSQSADTAIPMGGVSTPGYCFFKNLDATNYIKILTASGGTEIIRLKAGESAGPLRLAPGLTAPYARADTAACRMQYMVCAT